MKKFFTFLSLLLLTAALGGLIAKAAMPEPAADEATVVVHFHAWNGDYEGIGGHSWGGEVLVEVGGSWESIVGGVWPTGQDEFGLYFTYRVKPSENANPLGFIPVRATTWNDDGTIDENWDAKLSAADVLFPINNLEPGSVTHIYVFEGSKGKTANEEAGEVPYLVADPDYINMLLVFFDPANNYHENLGVHSWGWNDGQNASGWGTPLPIFVNVGVLGTTPVKAAMFNAAKEDLVKPKDGPGLLIYAGGDDTKFSGDIKAEVTPDIPIFSQDTVLGEAVPVFVLNAGAGNATNSNVFYGEGLAEFATEATAFRFDLGSVADGAGTFAYTKRVVYTLFNQALATNFTKLDEEEKEAAKAEIIKQFRIVEVVAGEPTDTVVPIEAINFNEFADEAKEFILTLGADLDFNKDYQVQFKETLSWEVVAKPTTVKFEVTAPVETENVYIVGSLNGWTPGISNWKMTKVSDGKFEFEVEANLIPKTWEYKYVSAPHWDYGEVFEGNRKLEIGKESTVVAKDTITEWNLLGAGTDLPAEAEAFELVDEETVVEPREAVLTLELDKTAPQLIFTSTFDVPEDKVIYIQQYSKWDQSLFPRFRADDNRDGDITHRVYVPGGQESRILDTNVLGDYEILLRVVDNWGHVTEETFIFRVVKKIPKK